MDARRSESFWFFLSFILLLFFFSTNSHLCSAVSTLSSGESLYSNQKLISNDSSFALGFFRPGISSPNYYIGIWYNKISLQNKTYVWVANRDDPFTDPSSSELKLLENGNLVLLNQSKNLIWFTNSTSNALNSSELVLRDDGNLVLRERSNTSVVFWQSFDHPTDTVLPGGKIGYDNITKRLIVPTSWKNIEDPTRGIFSVQPDSIGKLYSLCNRNHSNKTYWSSGPWNGQIFNLSPEMRQNYIYYFSYVDNENETYFIYNIYNKSIITRTVLDISGQLKQFTWLDNTQQWNLFWSQPRQQCEVSGLCGAFGSCNQKGLPFCQCLQGFQPRFSRDWNDLSDTSGGCVRKISLQCGGKDGFLLVSNVKLPEMAVSLTVGGAEECESACSNNCSCQAWSFRNGCLIWYGDLLNLQQLSGGDGEGRDLYLKLAVSELESILGDKKGFNTRIIVGAVSGIVVSFGLVLLLLCRWWKRRSVPSTNTVGESLVAFKYKDLRIATKNFSEKLGGGGFGSVFKGTLPDSTTIAVKKLEGSSQGEKQFRTEVSSIGTKQHVHLVRLRGFCSEGTERLLVYDYMPNSSLDSHLFGPNNSKILDWKTRFGIALGTARGLVYLHDECRDCIIHCDIKPENILLDADFCPKVADFGLAKLVGKEFSRVLTTMRGTRGYLAPEWISGLAITAKADVYSYGMMLFELISGRRNSEISKMFFPTWAASKIAEGKEMLTLIDIMLEGEADVIELTNAFNAACWCIQDDESHRPSMGQVVQILEGVLEVKPPPIPRSLQDLVESDRQLQFFLEPLSQ